jgi:hypothetical protein
MATYKDIHGNNIPIRASDPSNPILGEAWYNSTSHVFKVRGFAPGTWTSGNNMTGTVLRAFQSTGSYTAAVTNGGVSSVAHINQTSEWDGTNWSTGNAGPVSGFSRVGFGTQTAAVFAGGQNGPSTTYNTINEYDGTNWTTSPGTLVKNAVSARGTGTQTAGIIAGGYGASPSFSQLADAYTYDGTCMTAITSMPAARQNAGGSGSAQDAFILYGGNDSPTAATVSWNGSSWSVVNSLNNATPSGMAGSFSSQTSALCAATSWPTVAPNEQWDGTCWTVIANLSTQRANACGSGTGANGFVAGGYDNSGGDQNTEVTELWTGAAAATQTVTIA